jgi:L-ascorbate metabolism protein UlaG (beta-lactamase superfamily)
VLLTWWGHSSVTAQWAQSRILFDPLLVDSIGHLRRRRGPRPAAHARQADVVLISHLHADHCHLPSLRLLPPGTQVIGPAGLAGFLSQASGCAALRCQEVIAGDEVTVGQLTVQALHAEHDDRRSPMSRYRAKPLSFLVTDSADQSTLWFGGDTALHDGIAKAAPVDVALVPVAGWGPGLGPGHLDAEQAAEAVTRLRAKVAIPVHYGTLWPRGLGWVAHDQFLGPERQFADCAQRVAPETKVHILDPGETLDTTGSRPGRQL